MNDLFKKTLFVAFAAMGLVLAFHLGGMQEAKQSQIAAVVEETPCWYKPWETRFKVTYADGSSVYITE